MICSDECIYRVDTFVEEASLALRYDSSLPLVYTPWAFVPVECSGAFARSAEDCTAGFADLLVAAVVVRAPWSAFSVDAFSCTALLIGGLSSHFTIKDTRRFDGSSGCEGTRNIWSP